MDAVYLPFLVHDLRDFLAAVPDFGVRGFSVTHPHKQAILKYLKECDPLAAQIGAVNTVVVRRDGSLYGGNTDYLGLLRALEKKLRIKGSRVLIYGAGGAARQPLLRWCVPAQPSPFARAAKKPQGNSRAPSVERLCPALLCAPSLSTPF